jgi:hypothetical protein
MGVITLLEALSQNDEHFFVFLSITCFLCSMWSFFLLRKILYEALPINLLSAPALLLGSLFYSWMSFWGMETTIAIPLYLLVVLELFSIISCEAPTSGQYIRFGFLLTACALARIDLVLFDGLIISGWLLITLRQGRKTKIIKSVALILLGCLPIFGYYVYNYMGCGMFITTSALAKTMKLDGIFNANIFSALLQVREMKILLPLLPISFCVGLAIRKRLLKYWSIPLLIITVYPICYFIIYAFTSNWTLFIWYTFPLPIIIVTEFFVIGEGLFLIPKKWNRILSMAISSIIMMFFAIQITRITVAQTISWYQGPSTVYWQAERLKNFIKTHPGRYAMGDRAGLTQYLSGEPLFQAEGLVADRTYLSHIYNQDDLRNTLASYGLDYLIVSRYSALPEYNSNYYVSIPFAEQAGSSKKMSACISSDKVCLLKDSNVTYAENDPIIYTYILSLK